MEGIDAAIRRRDWFLRRQDLLRLGYTDAEIRAALARHTIFRVRQGWFSVADAPPSAVHAVRVGGRLTGVAALESYGLRVPRRGLLDIAVPAEASRLRSPVDRSVPLRDAELVGVRIHWIDRARREHNSSWRVSLDDALLLVVSTESRDVAVACASAVMRFKGWSRGRIEAVFARAPQRTHAWCALVSDRDEAHGETIVRLGYMDAGIWCSSQPVVSDGRRLDLRVGPNTYVEVDGAQHDPDWTGENVSSWSQDIRTAAAVTIAGGRVLHFGYEMITHHWEMCLAATREAVAADVELEARRLRDPALPRAVAALRRGWEEGVVRPLPKTKEM